MADRALGQLLPTRGAPVVGLLLAGGPAAILGAIGPVVINPVYGRSGRTRPHVGHELRKIAPCIADGNASATVVGIGGISGIEAAPTHLGPNPVEGVASPSECVAVGLEPLDCGLSSIATARGNQSSPKVATVHVLETSAIALAAPTIAVRPKRRDLFDGDQAAKPPPRHINLSARHGGKMTSNWKECNHG